MGLNILVSGTPGTGKTTLVEFLRKNAKFPTNSLNVSELVKSNPSLQLFTDKKMDSLIIDEHKTRRTVQEWLECYKGANTINLIESHSPGIFRKDMFDFVLILRTSTENLYDRLTNRGYSVIKIEENIDAEIMQVCLDEAREVFEDDKIAEIDSNDCKSFNFVLHKLENFLKTN